MAIKKSELYSSLWKSCDELRGGMDASQYKDYVLTLLFLKYVSDKAASDPDSLIEIPEGASFDDMIALKGKSTIGDDINKKIIAPIAEENGLKGVIDLTDFNDPDKLGKDKEMVDRLTKLIGIFENPALNFSGNRAEDDDILGDAYEFLMRHFATESGKSKGQFYTPSEVSRILSKVIDVDKAKSSSQTVYDPTCGSGSLLLKVVHEAPVALTPYGQEMDNATRALAVMNMWLHNAPLAEIWQGNTLAAPYWKESPDSLKKFDYIVANPPFSAKSWSNGIDPYNDLYKRFDGFGVPPSKNGDYAFMLHILKSLKSTGKAAVILPHGVLFRGNAEAEIRKNIIQRKWIKGIIGLPANLFYGTGIPACIIVLDKENAANREGVFMIDASKGYMKDGNKNRLREQDIHKIVDAFNSQTAVPKYSRFVPFSEIEENEYNLNIPRYIDTQEAEDIQDLNAHLKGGIPKTDIDQLDAYWEVYPNLRKELFSTLREGYAQLNVGAAEVKERIYNHAEFKAYSEQMAAVFENWKNKVLSDLEGIDASTAPKKFIHQISEALLEEYASKALVDKYSIYQHLMDYWNEVMKDDTYLLIEEGWVATVKRILEKNKKGKEVDKGWTCDLIPKALVINKYLSTEKAALAELEAQLETTQSEITSMTEEHAGDEGLLQDAANDKGSISKTNLKKFIKELDKEEEETLALAQSMMDLFDKEAQLKKDIKAQDKELDKRTLAQFQQLTEAEVRELLIHDKWLSTLQNSIQTEIDAISQRLTARIKELAGRYAHTLTELDAEVKEMEAKVALHLEKMGLY